MIIYFTGTGNSKYIAEILKNELEDTIVDAAELIKAGEKPKFSSEKPYVFVSPTYAWRLPRLFERWIQGCKFDGNQKAYFLLTCGDSIGVASDYIKKFSHKMNFDYMGTTEVIMPENYIVMFAPPTETEDIDIIAKATEHTKELSSRILTEQSFAQKKYTFMEHLYSDIVNPLFYKFYVRAKKFYATDACISCGQCVKNCMLNNVNLKDGKPVWGKNCTHCMACICKCPTEAIEYGKQTKGLRRYTCGKWEI